MPIDKTALFALLASLTDEERAQLLQPANPQHETRRPHNSDCDGPRGEPYEPIPAAPPPPDRSRRRNAPTRGPSLEEAPPQRARTHSAPEDPINNNNQSIPIDPAIQDESHRVHSSQQAHIPITEQCPPARAKRVRHANKKAEGRALAAKRRLDTQENQRASMGAGVDRVVPEDAEEDNRLDLYQIGPHSILWSSAVQDARKEILVS